MIGPNAGHGEEEHRKMRFRSPGRGDTTPPTLHFRIAEHGNSVFIEALRKFYQKIFSDLHFQNHGVASRRLEDGRGTGEGPETSMLPRPASVSLAREDVVQLDENGIGQTQCDGDGEREIPKARHYAIDRFEMLHL